MKIKITLLLLLISVKSFACECGEYSLKELDRESYEWSDITLIGNISKSGTKYRIEIKEILKGKIAESTIEGLTIGKSEVFSNCTFSPRKNGEYLLYLKTVVINEKTYYYSSDCLGSRLLNFEYKPVSLRTDKSKSELISATTAWLNELRKVKK